MLLNGAAIFKHSTVPKAMDELEQQGIGHVVMPIQSTLKCLEIACAIHEPYAAKLIGVDHEYRAVFW